MIRYIKRENIHDKKWNGCVHFGYNGLVYGYTWYLDNVTENWDGIVLNNYEAVLPVVWNRKYGIHYLYQPLFTQQLGIFSLSELPEAIINEMLNRIPEKFRFIEVSFNSLNDIHHNLYHVSPLPNFQLSLGKNYEEIYKDYSDNIQRNIKKAKKNRLTITTSIKPEAVVNFFRIHAGEKIPELKERDYSTLHRIIYQTLHYGMGQLYGVRDTENNLVATGFFIFNRDRIINMLPSANEQGRQTGATAYLFDYLIKIHAGKKITFDFEGSKIPSIANFYKGFGATEVSYWQLKRNNLPWYLKIFKR